MSLSEITSNLDGFRMTLLELGISKFEEMVKFWLKK